jgi:CelD/BcsL family acetyltransferase involved in cellulose biosynthesis
MRKLSAKEADPSARLTASVDREGGNRKNLADARLIQQAVIRARQNGTAQSPAGASLPDSKLAEAEATGVIPYLVDPIADFRWTQLIERDPRASVFHSPGWLKALRNTYGFEAVALTTSAPSEPLANGVVFCEVKSWLTGNRLVSLPFSDHCEPLLGAGEDPGEFAAVAGADRWRYVELRPVEAVPEAGPGRSDFREAERFWLHRLDLSPTAEEIFHRFHNDCVRRKIRKAEKEHVVYEEGNNAALLESFYQLLLRTRRRHRLPPQPKTWFQNLSKFLPDSIKFRQASKDGRPIASILTFSYKNKLMYKYGCSDERYHKLGGMQLLLWRAIQEAKDNNYSEFDLGRCERENMGLRTFKDRWGAARSPLTYWRYRSGKFSAPCPAGDGRSIVLPAHRVDEKQRWAAE